MDTEKYLSMIIKEGEEIELHGKCHDCDKDLVILATKSDGKISIDHPFWHNEVGDFCKCVGCYDKEPMLTRYQPCEVFSRVCGYLRPVKQYNPGKKSEFKERVNFKF